MYPGVSSGGGIPADLIAMKKSMVAVVLWGYSGVGGWSDIGYPWMMDLWFYSKVS
jgi:hypothetical protein